MPDLFQMPVAQPLGGPVITGNTQITVDVLTRPVTRIAPIVRDLVATNEGYFAEEIFATPGMTIEGGAVIYTPTFPEDLFLDPVKSIAPRAPGSEAPRITTRRRGPVIARPESWAGSIEVTDEARRINDVSTVTSDFRAAANTFADRIQTRAIQTLTEFVVAAGRTVVGTDWTVPLTAGVPNTNPAILPQRDFALVASQFVADKTGVRPNLVILNEDDAFQLDLIYGDKLQPLLDRYGLAMRVTPHQSEGEALFVRRGQVGVMAFEKPLDTELVREGLRKTDTYVLEATPVFVANDAAAVLRVTGIRG